MTSTFATNSAANSAVSYLHRNSEWQGSSISKLSSGSRIVKASDDAAGLAVGTKLKADVTALKQASTNADQAASLMQVADGAFSRIGDSLLRMKSLATQARSDVLSDTERAYLDSEYQEMMSQIDYIKDSTKFNGTAVISGALGASNDNTGTSNVNDAATGIDVGFSAQEAGTYQIGLASGALTVTETGSSATETVILDSTDTDFSGTVELDGIGASVSFNGVDLSSAGLTAADEEVVVSGNAATFQVGVTAGADDLAVSFAQTDTSTLGISGTDIKTIGDATSGAEQASVALDTAIETINTRRAELGANMSRVEKINENLATQVENLDSARSVLMDVDVAAEMTKFSTNQVMTQASTAMLAQANQLPQNLMKLLQ